MLKSVELLEYLPDTIRAMITNSARQKILKSILWLIKTYEEMEQKGTLTADESKQLLEEMRFLLAKLEKPSPPQPNPTRIKKAPF